MSQHRKAQFIGKFYQTFLKIISDDFYQNLTNNGIEETRSKSFYETSITLIPKQNKNAIAKKSSLSNINIATPTFF